MSEKVRINVRVEVDIDLEAAVEGGFLARPEQELSEGDLSSILGGFEDSATARIVEQERP